jgi:hypothetical protein
MLVCVSAERISRGAFQRDDGALIARDVCLAISGESDAPGSSDIRGTVTVFDDPGFARRYAQKRLVFVSTYDPDEKIDVFILDANGTCIAFPISPQP